MRAFGIAVLLLSTFLTTSLSGCVCDAEEAHFDVGVTRADETVRTLPMLISKETRVAGIPVPIPDSHGTLDLKIDIPHPNITRVLVAGLKAQLTVDGSSVPIHLVMIDGEAYWSKQEESEAWSGWLEDGETVRLWWTEDRARAATVADIILPQGKPYSLSVRFEWNADSCEFKASGVVDKKFDGFVRASVNAKTFAVSGTPMIETKDATVGFRANYTVKSGVSVTLDSSSALAVVLTQDALAAAVVPRVSWTVNGLPGTAVKAGDVVSTFSASSTNPTVYARSGQVVPPTPLQDGSVTILVQDLLYRSTDGTVSTVADAFAISKVG